VIFSDGLDVDVIESLHARRSRAGPGQLRLGHAADERLPRAGGGRRAGAVLLVCKAVAANGRPTVKLSDNPEKAMGPEAEIARYKRVFGVGEQERVEVVV
jgi:nicotinate phosphoribosyltransferase